MNLDDVNEQIAELSPAKRALLELRLKQKNRDTSVGPAISRRQNQNSAPLSFAQQRLWFLNELEPSNPSYHISHAFRIKGALHIPALKAAFDELVRRHEVLRTRFAAVDGQGIQLIDENGSVALEIIDLTEMPDPEGHVRKLAAERSKLPFDFAKGPLLRASLLRLTVDAHVLLTTIHHIVSDAWSMRLLFKELSALYDAKANSRPATLVELPIQYADFAIWQRQALQSKRLASQLTYWQKKLQGAPAALELPSDRPRPAVNSFLGAKQSFELSPQLASALNELSRREGVTLFMTLVAAFKTLLLRYTGRDDVVVGVPVAGRNRPEIEPLIGFFVNSLVLRTDLSGDPEFLQLLRRVRETTLEAYANQDAPFEQLVEVLQPERSSSHAPLFQVMFTLQHAPPAMLELNGLSVENAGFDNQTSKFDLTIFALENDGRLKLTFEYNTDLFDEIRIQRMAQHFEVLLASIVDHPNARLSELEILPDAERQRLLVQWNQTTVEFPENCIHRMFEDQVKRSPEAVAVVYEEQELTYAQLNGRANQLARQLRSLGVGPETIVGIYIERSLEMVVGLLAILKAGGAYMPLDPSLPEERLSYMLEDARVPVLLTVAELSKQLPPHQANVLLISNDHTEALENVHAGVTVDNLAYVIYTSGSTGKPKGVAITHGAICNHMDWMQKDFPLSEADRVLQKTPVTFDASVWEFYAPLLAGARLVMARPEGHQDSSYLVDAILQYEITTLQVVPTLLRLLLDEERFKKCRSLKRVYAGGEPLTRELVEHFSACSNASLTNLYGPTETTIDATYWTYNREAQLQTVPIGRPIANMQSYILDKRLKPVPIGIAGELLIGGPGVARGYINRPDLTAEKFVPNPRAEGQRFYKTGDLARYLADGNIEYLGRLDDQVKIRGFRIELGEIEAVLAQYPGVNKATVIVRTDMAGGDRLVAYVVGENTKELREYLRKQLPEYMVPSAIVQMEELPLTSSGKIDRRALPAPELSRRDRESQFTAPRTPSEEVISAIWSEILNVDPIGINDNFFHLGGHSLLAVQVISRIRATFKAELSLASFFESPTIAACAARIEKVTRDGHAMPPLVRVSREEKLPLSFSQQRLWFLDQLEQGSSFYHISRAFRFRGKLNIDALSAAVDEVVRRHEPLRTSFVSTEGMPFQRIDEPHPVPLPVCDLRLIPQEDHENELRRLASERIREPFDLSKSPLLRATLFRTDRDEWIFLLTLHHIAGDAWSLSVLFRELTVLYAAFAQTKPSPLPDLEIQLADFAAWQRSWLEGEHLEQHVSYWKQQLAGAPLVLELPTDKPRPAEQTFRGARLRFKLSPELTANVKKLSKQEGVTVFMTFLAAFQLLLSRYAGQTDLIVGTDVANRNSVETEAMIGFFVNVLPLRINLAENPAFTDLLRQVREITLRAYAHQDVPFEKLVAELKPKRDLSRNPLVQVLLVMQNTPAQELQIEGVSVAPFEIAAESSRFDLALFFWEEAGGVSGSYLYNPDLFDERTIERMSAHFETLLRSIIADPSSRIGDLRMKNEEELRQEEVEKRERHQLQIHSLRDTRRRGVNL